MPAQDDSTWGLDGGELNLTLEKVCDGDKKDRWPCVLQGHPHVDITAATLETN